MSWYLYDKNGFRDELPELPALEQFIEEGGADTQEQYDAMRNAVADDPELVELLNNSEWPLIVTDGGADSRIERFHADSEYDNEPENITVDDIEPPPKLKYRA